MAANLGELFIELGVFADTKELKQFEGRLNDAVDKMKNGVKENKKLNSSIGDFVKGLGAVVGAVGAATVALQKLTESLVKSNQEFLNLTRTSDISLSTFQKWNNVGKMLGVNNVAAQIENLNQKLFELKLTGQGAEGFMLAGINPMGQDAQGVMEQLRNRIKGLDDTSASYLLRQMGLDPSMLHLLRMTKTEFEELGATVQKYQLTDEQTHQIQALNIQLQIAQTKLNYLKDRAILAIMPYFVEFMKSLARVGEMLARVGERVGGFVVKWKGLAVTFIAILPKIKPIANLFKGMSKNLLNLISRLPVFGRLLAQIGIIASRAFLPFTAIYLLLDDIATYFSGGESALGLLLYFLDELNEKLKSLEAPAWLKDLFDILSGKPPTTMLEETGEDLQKLQKAKEDKKVTRETLDTGLHLFRNLLGPTPLGDFIDINKDVQKFLNPIFQKGTSNTNNTTNNTDNKKILMTNNIYTNETLSAIKDNLSFAQSYVFDR